MGAGASSKTTFFGRASIRRCVIWDISSKAVRAKSVLFKEVANNVAGENIEFLISDLGCWIVAEIAHAKVAKPRQECGAGPARGSGRRRAYYLRRGRKGRPRRAGEKVTLLRPADGTSKGWRPTTLLTRFAEELRRVGQKYEGAEVIVRW